MLYCLSFLRHFKNAAIILLIAMWFLPVVYASNVASLADSFASASPGITTYTMTVILILILWNGEFLCQHYLQLNTTHNPNLASSWIRCLSASIFSSTPSNLLQLDESEQRHLILEAANKLGLSHEFLLDPSILHSAPTLLGPSFFECQICGGWLKQTRQCLDIWILEDDGIHIGQLAQGNCQSCNTSHFPDHYHPHINGQPTNVYNSDAAYL
jgi:hypothetical protein